MIYLLRLVLCATAIVIVIGGSLYQVVNHGVLKVGFDRLIRRKNLWIVDSCETETTKKKSKKSKKYQKQQPLLIVSYYVERYFELTVAVRDL